MRGVGREEVRRRSGGGQEEVRKKSRNLLLTSDLILTSS